MNDHKKGDPVSQDELDNAQDADDDSPMEEVALVADSVRAAATQLDELGDGLYENTFSKGDKALDELVSHLSKVGGFDAEEAASDAADQWKTKSQQLEERIGDLAAGLDNCANSYAFVDGSNAVTINDSGDIVYSGQ